MVIRQPYARPMRMNRCSAPTPWRKQRAPRSRTCARIYRAHTTPLHTTHPAVARSWSVTTLEMVHLDHALYAANVFSNDGTPPFSRYATFTRYWRSVAECVQSRFGTNEMVWECCPFAAQFPQNTYECVDDQCRLVVPRCERTGTRVYNNCINDCQESTACHEGCWTSASSITKQCMG